MASQTTLVLLQAADHPDNIYGVNRYGRVWLPERSKLERHFQRKIPHPQSAHLTPEELAKLTPRDHEHIAAAAARRAARAGVPRE